jgi:hypothetical protein
MKSPLDAHFTYDRVFSRTITFILQTIVENACYIIFEQVGLAMTMYYEPYRHSHG